MGKWPEHMAKIREFLSLEQALQHAIKNLSDEDLISTKKKKRRFQKILRPRQTRSKHIAYRFY